MIGKFIKDYWFSVLTMLLLVVGVYLNIKALSIGIILFQFIMLIVGVFSAITVYFNPDMLEEWDKDTYNDYVGCKGLYVDIFEIIIMWVCGFVWVSLGQSVLAIFSILHSNYLSKQREI